MKNVSVWSRSRLESPFFAFCRSLPNLVRAGVGSRTSDFRSCKSCGSTATLSTTLVWGWGGATRMKPQPLKCREIPTFFHHKSFKKNPWHHVTRWFFAFESMRRWRINEAVTHQWGGDALMQIVTRVPTTGWRQKFTIQRPNWQKNFTVPLLKEFHKHFF